MSRADDMVMEEDMESRTRREFTHPLEGHNDHVVASPASPTSPRNAPLEADTYSSRLQEVLEDDNDFGQDRENDQGSYGEFQGPAFGSTSEDLDYFTGGGRDAESVENNLPVEEPYPTTCFVPQEDSLIEESFVSLASPSRSLLANDSPARSSYRRPSYLHPSISRLRAHDRKPSSSSTSSQLNPFGLSPSKSNHKRAESATSQVSGLSRNSSAVGFSLNPAKRLDFEALADGSTRPSSVNGGHLAGSVASGLPIQADETEERTAFTFQILRTASDILFNNQDSHDLPAFDNRSSPQATRASSSRRFSISTAFGGKGNGVGSGVNDTSTPMSSAGRGNPVILDVNGAVAVGTDLGWVMVFDFNQELKCVCGMESIVKEAGPVTALTFSPDGTFVGVGHMNGNVYLYDLKYPTRPARSSLALPLSSLISGRKEGHVAGTRIVGIDFVGLRRTAIVTSDETGRAFWWSLGKVIGVESNDVMRLLGGIPGTQTQSSKTNGFGTPNRQTTLGGNKAPTSSTVKKHSTMFASKVLPLGLQAHGSDAHDLTAFLTASKLVLVGLKPTPRNWYRRNRGAEGGDRARYVGSAAWSKAGSRTDRDVSENSRLALPDPILAYSWGNSVRLLHVRTASSTDEQNVSTNAPSLIFEDGLHWKDEEAVLNIDWLNPDHLLLVTSSHLSVLDIRVGRRVEYSSYSFISRLSWDRETCKGLSLAPRVSIYKGKVFILAETDLRVGTLMLWADHLLALCHSGDFLSAIRLAMQYYTGAAPGNTVSLPMNSEARSDLLKTRALALMRSSLEYAFSENRLTDGTYDSPEGRGVDLTSLFENLADECLKSCLLLEEHNFAYEDVYEAYANAGIQGIYLEKLEQILLESRLHDIPPNLIQAMIQMHDDRGQFDQAESIIWHVDPLSLDINQAINLCDKQALWDAYAYVFNQCMFDYITPVAKFISLMDHSHTEGGVEPSQEKLPQAYKLFAYLETLLVGCEYPDGRLLPDTTGSRAKKDLFSLLFNRKSNIDNDSKSEIPLQLEHRDYPVLRAILHYDTEALLHVLDIAFEDAYLNEARSHDATTRQSIVNILLETMEPSDFPIGDISFMHIFVARNLPKYPQFLQLPSRILHAILFSLAQDPDMTTCDDRQLAVEHLLSAYTPPDTAVRRDLFSNARFFRILRHDYSNHKEWPELVHCVLEDPDLSSEEVFFWLEQALSLSAGSQLVLEAIQAEVPRLLEVSIPWTAKTIARYSPLYHTAVLRLLSPQKIRQFAYLRTLLQPELSEDRGGVSHLSESSIKVDLDQEAIQSYICLLAQIDEDQLEPFLANHTSLIDLEATIATCEGQGHIRAVIWAMDRRGKPSEAISRVCSFLTQTSRAIYGADPAAQNESLNDRLLSVKELVKQGVQVCITRQAAADQILAESLWFELLAQLVRVAQMTLHLQLDEIHPEQDEAKVLFVACLRQCIQDTLAALISSSSSSTLSFPRLFRRLVQASDEDSDTEQQAVYSEFRLILVSMLDTYHNEEDMLVLVTKLVQGDVFDWMKKLIVERNAGWRSQDIVCRYCKTPFSRVTPDAVQTDGVDISASAICVPRRGLPYHWDCASRVDRIGGDVKR